MRDYTKPHPDAISQDYMPTRFIEFWKLKMKEACYSSVCHDIKILDFIIENTAEDESLHTVALLIIKPKKITL